MQNTGGCAKIAEICKGEWWAAQSEIHERHLFKWENKKTLKKGSSLRFLLAFSGLQLDDAVKWIPCLKSLLVFCPSSGR